MYVDRRYTIGLDQDRLIDRFVEAGPINGQTLILDGGGIQG